MNRSESPLSDIRAHREGISHKANFMNGSRPTRRALQPGANAATFLALGGLVIVGMGLLGLASLVMPQFLGILLVIGLFIIPVSFHYLVWGWWLSQIRERTLAEEALEPERTADNPSATPE